MIEISQRDAVLKWQDMEGLIKASFAFVESKGSSVIAQIRVWVSSR